METDSPCFHHAWERCSEEDIWKVARTWDKCVRGDGEDFEGINANLSLIVINFPETFTVLSDHISLFLIILTFQYLFFCTSIGTMTHFSFSGLAKDKMLTKKCLVKSDINEQ